MLDIILHHYSGSILFITIIMFIIFIITIITIIIVIIIIIIITIFLRLTPVSVKSLYLSVFLSVPRFFPLPLIVCLAFCLTLPLFYLSYIHYSLSLSLSLSFSLSPLFLSPPSLSLSLSMYIFFLFLSLSLSPPLSHTPCLVVSLSPMYRTRNLGFFF